MRQEVGHADFDLVLRHEQHFVLKKDSVGHSIQLRYQAEKLRIINGDLTEYFPRLIPLSVTTFTDHFDSHKFTTLTSWIINDRPIEPK